MDRIRGGYGEKKADLGVAGTAKNYDILPYCENEEGGTSKKTAGTERKVQHLVSN